MEAYRLQTGSMTGLTIPLQMKHLNPRGARHVPLELPVALPGYAYVSGYLRRCWWLLWIKTSY